ncbi:MAG: N-6 DNA methylase [Bacteroidota bacterium]|nr:N-6 DNA methylase [Bacteroidota bacterium]
MGNKYFHNYLITLGFSQKEISNFINGSIFIYRPHKNAPVVKYIHVKNNKEIFDYHQRLWNENNDNIFIAVNENKSYIIDCKKKPDSSKILSHPICIETFDYGVNSEGYEDTNIETISKYYIDSSFFYQFIQQKQRNKQEVDKDLLLNLIALRNDLIKNTKEQIVHLLILRCLFVKYLEDRGIFDTGYLSDILSSKSPKNLISAFDEVCKINGDIFGNKRINENEINIDTLEKLFLFFTTDYQSGQGTLFPYQFNNIPIQLISHVYEAFLNNRIKRGRGIYYTPSFVVDFMLSMSLKHKVKNDSRLTVLDPSVGSGAFLVESFKILRDEQAKKSGENKLSYNKKIKLLENQLWGIDVDEDALQIAAFSLYLALLEDEKPEFIRKQIKHSHPILPALIGKNLIHGNTITDDIFRAEKFDMIVSNPPWGSVPDSKNNIAEREAINNTDNKYPEYENVSDYERSQAFLKRIEKWQKPDTLNIMIVKNSVFLNKNTYNFRKDFLDKNQIHNFFELSHYNKILFKKKTYKSPKITVEIGASEPCIIVEFKPYSGKDNYEFNYISPNLTKLGEHFELIQYTENEKFQISKDEILTYDNLWRILVNSDYEGFEIIEKKIQPKKDLIVEARAGFQPKKDMQQSGKPDFKKIIEPGDFEVFFQKNKQLSPFNWNQKLHRRRDESIYKNSRILIPVRPLKQDKLKLRGIHVKDEMVFKHNIVSLKLKKNGHYIPNNLPYLGIINSELIGYYIYNISSQWGKGEEKRPALRNVDLETLPVKKINDESHKQKISELIEEYKNLRRKGKNGVNILDKIDEFVFSLYDLTEYEKEIIKEFYQVNVERADERLKQLQPKDIKNYFSAFKEVFSLVLSAEHTLNASYHISQNIGAIIKISIVDKQSENNISHDNTLRILRFVKNNQLKETDKLLREEKIKIYEPNHFYIIKSNQFKDWTIRQAYKDAKEEINLLISKLPDTNE